MTNGTTFPDLTLAELSQTMRAKGVRQLLAKELAPNDNSKNQAYLGHSLEAVNILPVLDIREETTDAGNKSLKAPLSFWWLQSDGSIAPAPGAQLIVYPQYPEVRLSGFLRDARQAPAGVMRSRESGRILFLGLVADGRIVAWAVDASSKAAAEIRALGTLERAGVFLKVPLLPEDRSIPPRLRLLRELNRIHAKDWIGSKALRSEGVLVDCVSSHCVGYTLEAELGIPQNARSEPDFYGWEVKASQTTDFNSVPATKVLTLMTPEPTGGYYKDEGSNSSFANLATRTS